MEIFKKTVLQAVTTGTTVTGGTIIIPNTGVTYGFKILLTSVVKDIGFFNAFVPEELPFVPYIPYVPYYYGSSEPIGLGNLLL